MFYLFWLSVSVMFYHLLLYGLIIKILTLFKKKNIYIGLKNFPSITVLCPAYNEESIIEEKIKSFLNLIYPKDKIEMIIISDDSTDNTNEIVKKYENENVKLLIQKPRKGKPSGHNLVEPTIKSDYVLSTDANSIFQKDAVLQLLKTMMSNDKIGIVSGELRLRKKNGEDSGEGLYWKFESFLKENESNLYSILGSNGSIYLIRRELFTQIPQGSVDDFERTLVVLKNGYIGKYNKDALVFEDTSQKTVEELGRKVRIISRQLFAVRRNSILLNFFRFPRIGWMLISHKILRWSLPLWSFMILGSSIILGLNSTIFVIFASLQIFVYLCGIFELILESNGRANKFLKLPSYFLVMNISALLAFIKFLKGNEMATWNTIREDN